MLTTDLLAYIGAALGPLAGQHGGRCDIAATEEDAIALLANGPAAWRMVIQYSGRGEQAQARAAIGPWQFTVWIQTARGLPAKPGSDALARAGGAPAILDLLDAVDGWIRALDLSAIPGVKQPSARLTGGEWVALENPATRQYRQTYETIADLATFPIYRPPTT